MTRASGGTTQVHLRVRVERDQRAAVWDLARRRRLTLSQLLRDLIRREVAETAGVSGSTPDESAVREMAILIAVELVLKLQEATIPGGPTLSRRLLEDAARAAIARVETVELSLQRAAR